MTCDDEHLPAVDPAALDRVDPDVFEMADAILTAMFLGIAVGLGRCLRGHDHRRARLERDLLRDDREAPRVRFLPRLAVALLQAPIFIVLMGAPRADVS